jgi:hypothetical protein
MRYAKEFEPETRQEKPGQKEKSENKRISKSIGEYVDYEETNKNDF